MSDFRSIDDVIRRLDGAVAWASAERSPLGYFAALYGGVTRAIKAQIAAGGFDDGPRMERFDIVFASRYLTAFEAHRAGRPATRSWSVAFDAGSDWWVLVVQHLMLGINAHINLDLGIAAAEAGRGQPIEALRADFDRISRILASLVDETQDALASVWPAMRVLDWLSGGKDEAIINFSVDAARRSAWRAAVRLAGAEDGDVPGLIDTCDRLTAKLGSAVWHPGLLLGTVTNGVRLGERGSVADKMALLVRVGGSTTARL
jgi:hypothetical protein